MKGVKQLLGLEVEAKAVRVSLSKTWIEVAGLNVFNPKNFSRRLMADVPEIYVDFDLMSFLSNKPHFSHIRLNIKEFIIVRNPGGGLNINSISAIGGVRSARDKKPAVIKSAAKPKIKIDILELKVGRVLYEDRTQVPEAVFEYSVNIDEKYKNITDVDKFVKLIVTRSLINTAVSKLADLSFGRLKEDVSSLLKHSKSILKGADSIEDIAQAVKGVTKELESIFKVYE